MKPDYDSLTNAGLSKEEITKISVCEDQEMQIRMLRKYRYKLLDNMAIFYAQTDGPILSVDVIPIGRVTSDLSVFNNLDSQEEVIFSLAE